MQAPRISTASVGGTGGTHRKWVENEGISLVEGFFVQDFAAVPLAPGARSRGLGVRNLIDKYYTAV